MQMKIKPVVIGLGYVGLPTFLNLQKNFSTIGFDINSNRILSLKKKIDINKEFSKRELNLLNKSKFSNDVRSLRQGNFYIVTVPTPVNKNNIPDLSLLKKSCYYLSKFIKKGDIIFFESTVYPTVTEKICIPILNSSGLIEKVDYFVGYSPERINPGDKRKTLNSIPKIVSFKYANKIKIVKKVYSKITKKIIFSKNIVEAETSKVIENIQRDLNIALMNEIYKVCESSKINFKNVIKLAKTKWNFVPFKPGLVGGHCLPVDPYYFSYFAKKRGIKTNIVLAGRKTNNEMSNFFYKKILKKLKNIKNISYKKIIILGITYKKNVSDLRNSLALEVYKRLKKKYHSIKVYDPYVDRKYSKKYDLIKKEKLRNFDVYIPLTNHDAFLKIKKFLKIKNIIDPYS